MEAANGNRYGKFRLHYSSQVAMLSIPVAPETAASAET
jgi:hypothetical protein